MMEKMVETRTYKCEKCQREWEVPAGEENPSECPECRARRKAGQEESNDSGHGCHSCGCGGH
jgi:DNA-directed RNA polymerase subunit RPC12/RpoP